MNYFDMLPLELLHEIARDSELAYKALLAYPRFARAVSYDMRLDYMVGFGHDVRVRYGRMEWHRNGFTHRCGNPAIVNLDGAEFWHRDGKMHRDGGGPAYKSSNCEQWYQNGELHRVDGPASIYVDYYNGFSNGKICNAYEIMLINNRVNKWFQNGVLHREDGPAIVYKDGEQRWYHNGILIRTEKPNV